MKLLPILILSFYSVNSLKFNPKIYETIVKPFGEQLIDGIKNVFDNNAWSTVDSMEQMVRRKDKMADEIYPTVTVDPLGTAVGKVLETYLQKEFYGFMGIPFATAGTFEMPQISESPWPTDFMGGYDATYQRNKCPQSSLVFPTYSGSEDCQYLNIYAPTNISNSTTKYPVMVWIYGGGFATGDTSLYVPSRLMEEDVIVVSVNYRLITLGFLYSGTTSAPGNMGLMDQVTALRWVKKYISYFNGDEENITVFGQSAGGASTSWMQFTKQTSAEYNPEGQLFQRVIPMSGSVLEVWTLDSDYLTSLQSHGAATGCYEVGDTPDDIVNCMKSLSVGELVSGAAKVAIEEMIDGGLGFSGQIPVVQTDLLQILPEEERANYIVIDKDPTLLIDDHEFLHVDVMTGSVRDEGSFIVGLLYKVFLEPNNLTDDEIYMKHDLMEHVVELFEIEDDTGAVGSSFRLGFMKDAQMGNFTDMTPGMVDLSGMLFLKTGAWTLTRKMTEKNPNNSVFFYTFEFESDDTIFDWIFLGSTVPIEAGVAHADDLLYLFALPSFHDAREQQMCSRLSRLWANFATFGHPTPPSRPDRWIDFSPEWIPYDVLNEQLLLIEDDVTLTSDYELRWNYNYNQQQNESI